MEAYCLDFALLTMSGKEMTLGDHKSEDMKYEDALVASWEFSRSN